MSTRLTPEDLAARWQRDVDWIRQHAPEFGGFKIGGYWRFDPADVDAYEERKKAEHARRDPLAMSPLSAKRRRPAKSA